MRPVASTQGEDYRPDGLTVPSGAKARFASNLAALGVLRRLEDEDRAAGPAEQEALAAWSGWGALPDAFSGANGWAEEAEQLRQSLTSEEYAAARANTLNAHYTDPAIVGAMWSALEEAGATQEATLLEPGSGSGNFMGQAPEGVRMIGVELDPLTARLSHYLYPSAQVRNEGFEQTVVRDGMVDGAVGNVPYGSFTLHDPMHNGAQLAIHNHFIVKALDATRAGGLVAVVTSGWTMDSQGTKARTEISKRGQLVAGVRLPTDSFSRVAGTKVNTDILVFQKHNEQVAVPNLETLEWGHTVEQGDVIVNKFFAEHPERVAGTVSTRTGRFGPVIEVTGASGGELGEQAGKMLTDQMRARGVRVPQRPGPLALRDAEALPGLFERLPDHERPEVGKIMYAAAVNGLEVSTPFVAWNGLDWAEVKVARPRVAETRALLDVRDRVASTLAAQSSPTSTTADREQTRARLNRAYTEYADKFGPINRFTLKERHPSASVIEKAVEASEREWRKALPEWMESSQRQAETPSEELRAEWEQSAIDDLTVLQKQQPHLTPLRTDPGLGSMLGLEIFDEETQEARKSQIFERDIITGAVQERHATTVDEAVAISMDEAQRVEVGRVAELLGIDEEQARTELVGAAYEDPETRELVPSALYLSGPVRDKLTGAESAAEMDERFAVNVEALRGVQPQWISIEEIDLVPGVNVLDASDYVRFAREVFDVEVRAEKAGDTWKLHHPPASAFSAEVGFRFGTTNRKPSELLEATMNQKPVEIRYRNEEKKMVLDRPQTAAARQKCDQITAAFGQWVLQDEGLRTRVERQWNHSFNQMVEPDFSTIGASLALPGLSDAFTPHPHQRDGVARMLHSPATLLNHVVGAGKTGTMVMAAMELRRTGRSSKPWIVVPNHLVEQITREASQWYPSARILSIPTGQNPSERQTWMARSAGQDWDMVVCPQSTFKLMGVAPALAHAWTERELDELRDAKSELGGGDGTKYAVKAIEAQIKTLETRAEKMLASKDNGMTFEQTGCDHLIVDEAHLYKNLARTCDITDLNHAGSQMASDLDMKIHALREHRIEVARRDGTWREGMIPHVVDFATGTPVANNLAEMWVMQRYLRPDVLEAQGTDSLREWARAFARTGQALEMSGDGVTWKVKDRIRSFANLPELISTNRTFMSTVTQEDIKATMPGALPELLGGQRQVHTREASEQVREYGLELKERAETRDPTGKDNMLKIIKDGQLVALDPRLRSMEADEDGGRIGQVADQIATIHDRTAENVYHARDGQEEPNRGGLQLVFLDSGVPGGATLDLYSVLRDELGQRGVPASEVAFIHDAATDEERGSLFERCRDGRVKVLIGSTKRMGTGVNVQRRAVALHHVDVPWRPDELEQREGRQMRQGNLNPEVEVHTYVTTGTIDAMSWQTIERKAAFIAQITKGTTTSRTVEQDDESMEKMARAVAAVAADSPLVMERVEVLNEITRLENLESSHRTELGSAKGRLRTAEREIRTTEELLPRLEATRDAVTQSAGIDMGTGARPTTETELADAIRENLRNAQERIGAGETPVILHMAGIPIIASGQGDRVRLHAQGATEVGFEIEWTRDNVAKTNFGRRLSNQIEGLPERVTKEQGRLAGWQEQAQDLRTFVEGVGEFAEADALRAAELRLAEIDTELGMTDEDAVETQRVYASEMEGRLPRPSRATELRAGDEFTIRGTKGQFSLISDGTVLQAVDVSDDSERRVNYGEAVELVSRSRSMMSEWECARVDLGEADALMRPRELDNGTKVLVGIQVGAEEVVAEAVVDSEAYPDGVRVTDGTDKDSSAGLPSREVIVRDYYTPEQLDTRRSAEDMLGSGVLYPGEIIADAVDESWSRRPEIAGAVFVDPLRDRVMLDGDLSSVRGWRVTVEQPERIGGDDLAALGVEGKIDVSDLRQGDRVAIGQVDRDAKSDRIVTVLRPASRYDRSAETAYRTDDGVAQTGRIKPGSRVEVKDRAISALSLAERVVLAEYRDQPIPDARVVSRAELGEHEGGTFLVREGAEMVQGTLQKKVQPSTGNFRPPVESFVLRTPERREIDLRTKSDEALILVDEGADVAKTAAAFDLTGGRAAALRKTVNPEGATQPEAGAKGSSPATQRPDPALPPAPLNPSGPGRSGPGIG